jgi:N-acetylmuramoyl-L-alanine amidase
MEDGRVLIYISLLPVLIVFIAGGIYALNPYMGPLLGGNFASTFFLERVTPEDINIKYTKGPINVLLVPGHDKDSYGTIFNGLKEEELNNTLAQNLFYFLIKDGKFNVSILKDPSGEYSPWFESYVENNKEDIISFRDNHITMMNAAKSWGRVEKNVGVEHNAAPERVSINLYGINKYANDNNIDIVIHIHFNDYPRRVWSLPGKYTGLAIYKPEEQLPNSRVSAGIAESLKKEIGKILSGSNLPGEQSVVVPDQELIAVGSHATRDGASVLVEYGYIYEPYVQNESIRPLMLEELAYRTYMGVKRYFEPNFMSREKINAGYDTTLLPASWEGTLEEGMVGGDVLKLQAALLNEELYPPTGSSLNTCPVSGYYGACTKRAVSFFQEKYKEYILKPLGREIGTGIASTKTLDYLNYLYGN